MLKNCMHYFVHLTVLSNFVPFLFFLEEEQKREGDSNVHNIKQTVYD